jgi:LacI family transcriptional regulator
MATRDNQPRQVSSGRRDAPLVLIDFPVENFTDWPKVIIERARELNWRLLDLRFRRGVFPEGVVLKGAITSKLPNDPLVRKIRARGGAVVRLGTMPHPLDRLVPVVMPDWRASGLMAAAHFAERGFKHFGYVGHHRPLAGQQKLQYEGLKAGAAQYGGECHLLELPAPVAQDPGDKYCERRTVITEWLKTVPKPVGLLGFVDGFASSLCEMCRDTGIVVPEEVAVLGVGNIPSACVCTLPTLSSIDPDLKLRAETAVRLLQDMMAGRKPAGTRVWIPPRGVVVRESTDVLAVADPSVSRAMRFMWDHLDRNLSVEDVAREAGVSRRKLERAFRCCLGRGVNAELRRRRLEACCGLLRTTEMFLTGIATKVGFRSREFLHRSFAKTYGMTPADYRREQGMTGEGE